MITKDNFKQVLDALGFKKSKNIYSKKFSDLGCSLKVDFKTEKLIYPLEKGFTIAGEFTTSFTQKENFVVFECVHRLFLQGYKPEHIELEPKWTVGHGASGGRADIMVKDNSSKSLLIIECKTAGTEFTKEWDKTKINGGQILSYAKQAGSTQFVALYTSDIVDGKVKADYFLITLKDNAKLLEELADKEPLSFAAAKLLDKEDIYEAWTQTYDQHYETRGVFEESEPYLIGKSKYGLQDLQNVNSTDIQGKYHQFATILRQHNVSGRENAFDKLVNLFLCKIVDETNNPNELKFYWKGIAYDSYFDLQDRLQKLYQEGMKRFLGEDVTYIDNDAIENAFRFFKNDPDATRETIKKYFRQLKFFTNNDFAFVDVHNEKLFYQNASILLKMVRMLQDIKLKTDQENQFLGDMFEGFLDQGVKQSEGQFFTPMPIVKFILKSLPLKQIVTDSEEIPKVIDYACGAGHFLNEYAKQIKAIVEQNKEAEIEQYYGAITGIEKEYRLSKVAKVSSFMYGQDDIEIIYGDALSEIPQVKNNSYSVLVANPPYSVKGYLETLPSIDRKRYELINTIEEKSYSNNNSIETFFIERAKQLLKPGGVAAIIVPSSILNKGKAKSTSTNKNIYVATREILLKYFDIVAISEFGSGTFGKTGTNTVTLFIRRKEDDPAPAKHFENRINDWFKNDLNKDKVFEDKQYIKKYCNHLEIKYEYYITLLRGNPSDKLLEHEIFAQYKKEFDKWSTIKNYKKSQSYKQLSSETKKIELDNRFTNFLVRNEKEKLYYFVLASLNPQEVLIVKSPSKNSEMKEFLGYEWSSAKGNEGIKYLGNATVENLPEDDEDEGVEALENDDKRVLANLLNFQQINTPLYDPQDNANENKINYWIGQNFEGKDIDIPQELQPFLISASLCEMMNFNLPNFNKSISLSPSNTIKIETKWALSKLSSVVDIISGGTPSTTVNSYWNGEIPWLSVTDFNNSQRFVYSTEKTITTKGFENSSTNYLEKEDIIISARGTVGAFAQLGKRMTFNQSCYGLSAKKDISNAYLYYILGTLINQFKAKSYGSKFDAITISTFDEILIPVPPENVQQKIVDECQAIDKEAEQADKIIANEQKDIEKKYSEALDKATKTVGLNDEETFEIIIGKRVLKREINKEGKGIPIYSANVYEPFGFIEKDLLKHFEVPSILWGIDGDWMTNYMPENKPFYPTDHSGVLRIKNDTIHPKYLVWALYKEGERLRFSRSNRASMDSIKGLSIQVPPNTVQQKLVSELEKSEAKIQKAKEVLTNVSSRKEQIIKKYL